MGKAQSLPISVLVLINPLLSTPQHATAVKKGPQQDGRRAHALFLMFKCALLKKLYAEHH